MRKMYYKANLDKMAENSFKDAWMSTIGGDYFIVNSRTSDGAIESATSATTGCTVRAGYDDFKMCWCLFFSDSDQIELVEAPEEAEENEVHRKPDSDEKWVVMIDNTRSKRQTCSASYDNYDEALGFAKSQKRNASEDVDVYVLRAVEKIEIQMTVIGL